MPITTFIANVSQHFYFESCWRCGVVYGVTKELNNRRRMDGKSTYCPNGHAGCYLETEKDRLKKQVEREKRARLETEGQLETEKRYTNRLRNEKRALKGAATKLKKRIAAGVCPCCRRTFKQLARHMENKHPDFTSKKKK